MALSLKKLLRMYLDNNSTTQTDPVVFDEMQPYFEDYFGNPSSLHGAGRRVRDGVEKARASVASLINCSANEIIFTSGGTESINSVIDGSFYDEPSKKLLTSTVEHAAVEDFATAREKNGSSVIRIRVDGKGCLDLEKLEDTIKNENEIGLVSIIWAHNETGILSPVQEIAELCNREGIPLHLDAVQAVGKIPVDVTEVKCDFLSISAHKFHGPKGVGALFIRDGIGWHSRQIGGGQEKSRRAGTEAVPNIIGLGKASEIAAESLSTNSRKVSQMRDSFESAISKKFSFAKIIGKETPRLPNTSNICFDGFEAETLLPLLDMRGICVSHGAACSSGSWGPPRVLKEMGLNENLAKGSVRFSWGKFNKKEELSEVSSALKEVFHILK